MSGLAHEAIWKELVRLPGHFTGCRLLRFRAGRVVWRRVCERRAW